MSEHEKPIKFTSDAKVEEERQAGAQPPIGGQQLILYDIATIVGAVYQQRIIVTRKGTITKRIMDQLRPRLQRLPQFEKQQVDTYIKMLFHVAERLGLINLVSLFNEDQQKPYYRPAMELGLKEWSQSNVYQQARQFIAEWRMNTEWHNIWSADIQQWDVTDWNPLAARGLLMDILGAGIYKTEQWCPISTLLDLIWAKGPYSLRPMHYRRKSRLQNIPIVLRHYWDQCEGIVYRGILASTLSELGIVSITQSTTKSDANNLSMLPGSFKLTDFGASIFTSKQISIANKPIRRILTVQPSFELILTQFDPTILYRLLPFTEVQLIEQASRLNLTQNSIHRVLDADLSIEEMINFLNSCSKRVIPQNVIRTMNDWTKAYRGGGKMLEIIEITVKNEAIADELCTSAQWREYDIEKIAPYRLLARNVFDPFQFRHLLKIAGIVNDD